ncbi:MAG: RNA-binding cell elongation regulator Jag/EloR [Christensenellales bacterium]
MLSYEGVGKSIEKAIEDALLNLKAPREDCDIKILEEGGLFKKARVLVSISEDCQEKYQTKKEKIKDVEEVLDIKKLISEDEEHNVVEETMIVEEIRESVNENPKQLETKKEEEPTNNVEREKIDDIKCVKFLRGLCEKMNIEAEINCYREGDRIVVCVNGDKVSELIGYRGDCLNGVQYLLNVIEQRCDGEKTKIVLDIENYREKRESTLIALANRMARKVAKTHHQIKLEPMTPNERRIIHTALQNDAYVTTFSKGTEPNRYLIIAPKH